MDARMSPSGAWAASHAPAGGAEPRAVALSDLLIARPAGLTHPETWAILFHAVQALQDLLLSDDANEQFWLPMIHPGTIFLTCKGRVTLSLSQVVLIAPDLRGYTAPEYRPGKPKTDTEFEKMLVYSLGATLQGALGSERASLTTSLGADPASRPSELSRVLAAMGKQLVNERASLMHLLDVISEYSVHREQTKPFSHTIMDLYRETIIYKNALPDLQDAALKTYLRHFTVEPYSVRNILPKIESSPLTISQKWNINSEPPSLPDKASFTDIANFPSTKIIGATSTKTKCTNEEPIASQAKKKLYNRKQPVKRAASRLYRAFNADKWSNNDQADCVGPEFVIRASLPSKQLYLGDVKCENLKKLIIIMLNGVKLEISCRPEATTAKELFSEIVRSENIEDNFFLGLAILIAGDFVFVPSDVKLSKIIALEQGIDTLFVRVRFFLSSLRGIRNHQSRHLLYLQLRRSLLENQLPCTVEQLCELGGLALQVEFGDYTEKHKTNHYFLMEHYVPEVMLGNCHDVEKLRDSLTEAHVVRSGLSKEKATESFISMAQALTFYGFHVYSATWIAKSKHRDIWLCISASGINLYVKSSSGLLDNSPEVQEVFKWQSIRTLCYSKHFLCIFPMHTSERKALPRKYKLKMDHKKSYYAFRLASLHHQFFHRLRNEYSSLQPISQQFGVLLKDLKNETNSLYKLGKLEKPFNSNNCEDAEHKTEFRILLGNKYKESLKKNKCKRSKSVNELSSDKNIALEEYQNKENEFDSKENMCDAKNNYISLPQTVGMWDKRKGVLMGTRAFSSGGQRVSRSLEAVNAYNVELSDKLSNTSSTNILMTDAYVLNSSVKSCEDEFLPDFQETLSESLLNKLKNISFVDERILKSVTIFRDIQGSLGLQVMEGSDNKAYVQSVVAHGPAALSGNIFKGDQIVAVNGQNLLNLKYSDALEILKNTGHKVELVLSQLSGSTFVQSTLERKPSVSGGRIGDVNAADGASCDTCLPQFTRYKGFQSVDKKCTTCTCNLEHHPSKDRCIHYGNIPDLHRTGNTLGQGLNRVLCNTLMESKPQNSPQECSKPLNCMCTNLRYKDCDIAKKEFDEIALPRSIRLGCRWRGPVRYPVTPIKKPVSQSDSDSSYFLNTSDEEQIFI